MTRENSPRIIGGVMHALSKLSVFLLLLCKFKCVHGRQDGDILGRYRGQKATSTILTAPYSDLQTIHISLAESVPLSPGENSSSG